MEWPQPVYQQNLVKTAFPFVLCQSSGGRELSFFLCFSLCSPYWALLQMPLDFLSFQKKKCPLHTGRHHTSIGQKNSTLPVPDKSRFYRMAKSLPF